MKPSALVFPLLSAAMFAAGPAFADPEPQLISKQSIASFRKPDGSVNNDAFGGGSGMANFFNNNRNDDVYIGPNGRAANGSYVLLEFSKDSSMPSGGWYITSIDISSKSQHPYSLYYSANGSSWTGVPDGVGVAKVGTGSYAVGEIATHVRVVFDEVGGWTPSVCEIEVYGVDPSGLACLHPESAMTAWELLQGTANCTECGIEQRQCTNCGEWFRRESSSVLPMGHAFQSQLDATGTSLQYGTGSISCSRCDWSLDLPYPTNLVNTVVDGTKIGRVPVPGQVNFTDVTVSSTGQEIYGVTPNYLINNNWTAAWNNYWFAASNSTDEYAQYEFGVAIDLAWIDVSVPNRSHTLRFYSVEADGSETLVGEHAVEYDSSIASSGNDSYQRFSVEFRGVTLKTLRVKSDEANSALTICELHPYGTVAGAGKSAAVRTRIIID